MEENQRKEAAQNFYVGNQMAGKEVPNHLGFIRKNNDDKENKIKENVEIFLCQVCQQKFETQRLLSKHIQVFFM